MSRGADALQLPQTGHLAMRGRCKQQAEAKPLAEAARH